MTEGIDGEGQDNADIVQSINANGHTIGNHTNTHHAFPIFVTPPEIVDAEIQTCEDKILATGVPVTKIFRAPYLAVYADLDALRTVATNKGYQLIWGSLHEDWQPTATWEAVADDIIDHMTTTWNTRAFPNQKPKPNILVLHDAGPSTALHIDDIVARIRDKGFSLVHFDRTRSVDDRQYYLSP